MSYKDKGSEPIKHFLKQNRRNLEMGKEKGGNYVEEANLEKPEVVSVLGIVLESVEAIGEKLCEI